MSIGGSDLLTGDETDETGVAGIYQETFRVLHIENFPRVIEFILFSTESQRVWTYKILVLEEK